MAIISLVGRPVFVASPDVSRPFSFWQQRHVAIEPIPNQPISLEWTRSGSSAVSHRLTSLRRHGCTIGRSRGSSVRSSGAANTAEGALIGGAFADLKQHYGLIGGLWRGIALSVLEREVEPDRLLMDGIAVVSGSRGMGIGSALLDAITREAIRRGKAHVRLDVIDSNPRARALYQRKGFVAGETQHLGALRHVFCFRSATTMLKSV